MPDEQNQQNEQFNLQLPEIPETTAQNAPATDQIQYASQEVPQAPVASYATPETSAPLQYATPGYSYTQATQPLSNPNTLQEKLKLFFTKPLGKIILFTLLFLGIAGMIMYSTNSVGLKGSFIDKKTGGIKYIYNETVLVPSKSDKNVWEKAKIAHTTKNEELGYLITDSNEKSEYIPEMQIAPLDIHPTTNFIKKGGQFIAESQYNPGKFYSITVKQLNSDGTVTATTNDDQTEYNKLELKNIYIPGGDLAKIVVQESAAITVGSKVLGNWESNTNRWSQAVITKVNSDGTFDIKYDDGDIKNNRKKSQIVDLNQKHPVSLKAGQIVIYKHPSKDEWYNALIIGEENKYQAMLVGVEVEGKDPIIENVNLQNAYLTLEGVKEMDGAAFVGDLSKPQTGSGATTLITGTTAGALLGITSGISLTMPIVTSIEPATAKPGESDKGILLTGSNLSFLTQNTKAITFDDPNITSSGYTDGFGSDGKSGHIFLNIDKKTTPGTKKITITNDKKEAATFTLTIVGQPTTPVPENKPPLAPAWNAPAATAELSTADLAKTEFKWTAGVDPDSAPSKTPNYQFAIIKGEITDQSEITKIFTDTAAEANKKYELAWIVRWTEKSALEEMQKLLNLTNCVADIGGGNVAFICNKFMIPSSTQLLMKEGQKYTAIVQQGDGAIGSPYATTTFSLKKQEDCPTDQYYIKDSKNAGCKKIPNFKGAFAQAGFICGLYKTILTNPDNGYRLSDDTKTTLQANLDTQCSKKPDAVTNTCLTKMTYIPKGKTLCEPLKIITDPLLSKDVCDQYTAEKDNKSLSSDTTKQLITILGVQCKPKVCPTGKFLNGPSVPENCATVITFPTKLSNYDTTKSCNTMKKISESPSATALSTYQIDQPTLDQIKLVAASEGCNPKQLPAAPVTEDKPKDPDTKITDNKTSTDPATCSKGYYLSPPTGPSAVPSTAKDCKKLPDLIMLTSISEIGDACKLYKDLSSGKLDGKLDAATTLQVNDFSQNVLCDQAITSTPKPPADPVISVAPVAPSAPVAFESADSAPPSLSMPSKKPAPSNILSSVSEAPPSLSFTPTPTAPAQTLIEDYIPPVKSSKPATPSKPRYYEPLPKPQTANYQPAHPVAGSYVPRSTAKTGPEMWIYPFGLAFATIASRRWNRRR